MVFLVFIFILFHILFLFQPSRSVEALNYLLWGCGLWVLSFKRRCPFTPGKPILQCETQNENENGNENEFQNTDSLIHGRIAPRPI